MKTIPKSIDDLLMYRIASMYYKDDLSQAQIARRIGLSRPQISRYLKRARETGMVEININDPYAEESEEISKRIKSLLGLKDAVVTPLERSKNDDE
ncbi:MAG TPA: MarR family transcriptional regulator, partial [Mesotoga infera]|nr:MarR family transcriptional regulator [Mesotoga infera]